MQNSNSITNSQFQYYKTQVIYTKIDSSIQKELWHRLLSKFHSSIKTSVTDRQNKKSKSLNIKSFQYKQTTNSRRDFNKDIFRCAFQYYNTNNKTQEEILTLFQDIIDFATITMNYYQGYLDLVSYFFCLFEVSKGREVTQYLQFINEFYLKDFVKIENTKDETVLMECIAFFKDIFKVVHGKNEDDIIFPLHLSWVFTLFTHEINDFDKAQRVISYLMMSKPYVPYVLSSVIIAQKFKEGYKSSKGKIQLDNVDFNNAIIQTERVLYRKRREIEKVLNEHELWLCKSEGVERLFEKSNGVTIKNLKNRSAFAIISVIIVLIYSILYN